MAPVSTRKSPSHRRLGSAGLMTATVTCVAPMTMFPRQLCKRPALILFKAGRRRKWRGQDLNLRPRGYEPRELPDCSTPRHALPEFLHAGRRFVRVREEDLIISAASGFVESRERNFYMRPFV